MTKLRRAAFAAVLTAAALSACSPTSGASHASDARSAAGRTTTAATRTPATPGDPTTPSSPSTPPQTTPPPNPPAKYTSAWPERTTHTAAGYAVNTCVPKELRDKATTLTTSDGVHLSALELGDGPDGVLLDHEQGYSICSFIDIGQDLAAHGYRVVIPEYRNHGASEVSRDNKHIDRDARAALAELQRLGARRVLLGGASCGGTTAMVAGVGGPLPVQGLLIMSSPARCGSIDAVPAVRRITAPSLFIVSPGDEQGAVEKQVRELYGASGAKDKKLVINPSGFHGTSMIHEDGARGLRLKADILRFITRVDPVRPN